ncbi:MULTISPECIES: response regulator [unclassified Campylobacter]|uniref:response regulator n=1 Tax=unclassified Campylobacter TaxID=2593542 RepID=UPI003D3294DA
MKILIVENEIYLAGSISSKLGDVGFDCEIANSVKDALKHESADIILLSTTLGGQDFYPIIEKFKNTIIILFVTYISSDTVQKPIQAGASDYIQKPFMIEELLRKINHFIEYKRMKSLIQTQENYIKHTLEKFKIPDLESKKIKLPLLIKTPKIQFADKFVFRFTKEQNLPFSIANTTNLAEILNAIRLCKDEVLYINNLQNFNENEREAIVGACYKKRVILATNNFEQSALFETMELAKDEQSFSVDSIVTLDEYLKHTISTYQDRYPDTELAKKLGISRKSLWEKRKKYDISKKK